MKKPASKKASQSASKAKTQSKPSGPLGRFITIKNRRVTHETEELSEAMTKRNEAPNGVSIYGRVASDRQHPLKVRDDEPKKNPLAEVLETLSHFIEEEIVGVIESAGDVAHVTDGLNSGGWTFEKRGMAWHERRTSTNKECAIWHAEVTLEAKFDLRKKLPPQVAKWLRKQAAAFIKAAASVESLEDDRNMKVIRKLVADESFLPSVIAQHLEFEYDGSLVHDPIAEIRAKMDHEASK